MKKLLLSSSIVALLLPTFIFAAYSDVSLTTDVDLSVNSISLDVYGSTAAVESIAVDSTSFTTVLQTGSYLKVSAASLNQFVFDILNTENQSSNVDYVCTGSASTLEVSTVASTTIIVTPSSSVCTDAAASSTTGSSKSDERSGGGGVTAVVIPVTPALAVQAVNAEAIAAIKTQLISLIQQLVVLLTQELQAMQASDSY